MAARAVIIGGGMAGTSVAYHLTKLGWKNVLLLEQGRIGPGTTWHAAGMVGQLRGSSNLAAKATLKPPYDSERSMLDLGVAG